MPHFWEIYNDRPGDFSTYGLPWSGDYLNLEKIVVDEIKLKFNDKEMTDMVIISGVSHSEWILCEFESDDIEGFIVYYGTPTLQ